MTHAKSIRLTDTGTVDVPPELVKHLEGGEVFVVVKDDDKVFLEEVNVVDEQFLEDREFSRRTREAWKRYENGEFRSLPIDEFLEEMRKW